MRIARTASTSVYGEGRRESRYDERDDGSEALMTMNGEAASATRVDEVLDLVGQRAGATERDVLETVRRPLFQASRSRRPRGALAGRHVRRGALALELRPQARPRSGARARVQPLGRRRLAIDAHDHRDRQRRHAVPRRLGVDGGQSARSDAAPHRPSDPRRAARRARHADRHRARRRSRRSPRVLHPRRDRPHHGARAPRGARCGRRARAGRRSDGRAPTTRRCVRG